MPRNWTPILIALAAFMTVAAGCAREDKAPEKFRIVPTPFPQAFQGIAYSHTAVTEHGMPPVTWSVGSGNLPAGLGLDPTTGEIQGTPTTLETANFTLQAVDALSAVASESFSITVSPPPLTITTSQLPPAQIGAAYNVTLQHMGGSGSPSWTLIGSLPTGLSLGASTGAITGTASSGASPTIFDVQVTDGTQNDMIRLAIEIDPAAMTVLTVRKNGSGGAYTSVTQALSALPAPIPHLYVIEIDDDSVYQENLTVNFAHQTGTEWLSIRSAFDKLPTIEAAVTANPVIHLTSNNVELRGLRVKGASTSQGVIVDDAVSQVWAVNCIFEGNQTAFVSGNATNVSFINNTVWGPEGVFVSGGGSCRILNNVIYATGAWAIRSLICSSDHNLFYAPNGAVGTDGTNLYVTLTVWQGSGIGGDANSISADPLYVDPPNGDFHLQTSSPALDLGSAAGWDVPVTDALSRARNLGGASDMGAFEDR